MREAPPRQLPYDVELEQALLGSISIDEKAFWRVAERLAPDDFFDPLHQRMFRAIARIADSGGAATPLTLNAAMAGDPGLAEVGGQPYLVSLARAAPAMPNLVDYARALRRLAQRRAMIRVAEELLSAAYENDIEVDPVMIADDAAETLYDATHGNDPGEGAVSVYELAERAVKAAELAHNTPAEACLSSGLKTVDEGLGAIFRGDLMVLGAPTSMGKTALVQGLLLSAAHQGHGGILYSMEMRGESVATRHVSDFARVPSDRIRQGRTTTAELDRIAMAPQKLAAIGHLYRIDSSQGLSVAQIRARTMAFKRRCPQLAIIVIDHLQYVRPSNPRADEKEAARQITADLCSLAKELNIAVVLISHLTKENERRHSKRPIMNDLYGSSGIAQNADSVWFLYRAAYYLEREPPDSKDGKEYDAWVKSSYEEKGKAEIFSTKVRMGKTGSVRVGFDETYTRFYDLEPAGAVSTQEALALVHGR